MERSSWQGTNCKTCGYWCCIKFNRIGSCRFKSFFIVSVWLI